MIDVLHAVDLGIASHIIGNVIWILVIVRCIFGKGDTAEKLNKMTVHLKAWYKGRDGVCQLQGKLTGDRLKTSKGWPKLKAKGAQTKHLAKYVLGLAAEFCGTDTYDRQMVAVCQLLVDFYDLLDQESMFLSPDAAKKMKRIGQNMGLLYTSLAAQALAAHQKLWKTTPKLHLFCHLCEWQAIERGNPRYYWCYPDEDLVGLMVEIVQSVHPRRLAVMCLLKWLILSFAS